MKTPRIKHNSMVLYFCNSMRIKMITNLSLTFFFFLNIQLSKERLQDKGNNLTQTRTIRQFKKRVEFLYNNHGLWLVELLGVGVCETHQIQQK